MIEISIPLRPNCKKSTYNWATMQQRETWGVKAQFFESFCMQTHAKATEQTSFLQQKVFGSLGNFLLQLLVASFAVSTHAHKVPKHGTKLTALLA